MMDDSKVSILIVDDKPDKLLSIEAVLEDLHQNIVRAFSGREALRHVLTQEFAVILLDVNMPDMDGFETAQLIRQRPSSAHVPIIFLTAMSDEMHVARGYSLGAVDYILTPVVAEVLRSKVAVFVDLFRKNHQVRLQAERLRQRATQLHRLTSASLAINSMASVQRICQVATQTAQELIGVHQGVMIANPGNHPSHAASCSLYSDKYSEWRSKTPAIGDHSMYGLVCSTNKPIRMTNTELEAHAPPGAAGLANTPPLHGLLAAPLTSREGKNMGLILLSDKSDGAFTDDDQAVLVQLAQMASVAIENTIFAEEREANRLKDEFLSTLSHELRTPLNAIAGWVQLLRASPSDATDVNHGLEVIERNVKSQTRLIEDLLDLSRITTGKLRLQLRPIKLRQVAEAALDAMRPVLAEKQITGACQFDGASDTIVNGDAERLQQVCTNLLNNAIKFTPSGGVITIRASREANLVHLSVVDSGEGIAPEFLPYVFDRFRQADSTSSRRHGGLGIGLTIVQHIVRLHRGTIRAESAGKGMGAAFTVSLPVATVALLEGEGAPQAGQITEVATTPGQRVSFVSPEGERAPLLSDIRILVVDDEPDAREVVAQFLHRSRARVTTAGSVAEALKYIASRRFDIIVTDLAMPGQDGFELLKSIRQFPETEGGNLPVIALTAYARPEDQAQTSAAGFNGHLNKPVDPAELIRTVHQISKVRQSDSRQHVSLEIHSPASRQQGPSKSPARVNA